MKPTFAVILSSLLLVQSLLPRSYNSLFLSAEVWHHYTEHKAESKQDLSLLDFLEMHYGSDSKHTKEKHHHLPQIDLNSTVGLYVLPNLVVFDKQITTFTLTVESNFFWLNLYSFAPTETLICPPRA